MVIMISLQNIVSGQNAWGNDDKGEGGIGETKEEECLHEIKNDSNLKEIAIKKKNQFKKKINGRKSNHQEEK
jgi:hypothetical protein